MEIEFSMIADDTGSIANLLGMIHPSKGINTVRTVFIIDPEEIVRAILYCTQELGKNVGEILRMMKGLQVCNEKDVALPENWSNNEIIGDKVIIPPATDEQTAKERLEKAKAKEIECFDWWFYFKKA